MTCQSQLVEQLRNTGVRLTPQRAMVLEIVHHSQGHLTVDEVHAQVRAASPYVDLATTYRTLALLKQNGLVSELRLEKQPIRFEAVRRGEEHHHAVCSQCGAVLQVEHADLASLEAILREKYGFRLEPVHVTLPGLCHDCASSA